MSVLARHAGVEYTLKEDATPKDLATKKYKSLIIVTGASLKGMGAAGVSIEDELKRTEALIAEARKQGMTVIGAHVEGMSRRAQGAAPGDNSDEMSIDAVCPKANFMIVRKDGNEDGRFTAISKAKKIPLVLFEKNLELVDVLKGVFAR
jgi:selenophosphate synthase